MSGRILVVGHGHPVNSPGGGEIAARSLFLALRAQGIEAHFLAACPAVGGGSGARLSSVGGMDDETLVQASGELFTFSQADTQLLVRDLPGLLRWFAPTLVHFHHYIHLGLDMFRIVRRCLPGVPILLTLHEYLAICAHDGVMVRRQDGGLCMAATPLACHACFPDRPAADFMRRSLMLQAHFDLIDHFIAPSAFLRERYIDWGLPADRITVLDNPLPTVSPIPPRPDRPDMSRGSISFFGQLSARKGVDVLLTALTLLPPALLHPAGPLQLTIHGSNLQLQPETFQSLFRERLMSLGAAVSFEGPYNQDELATRMADTDWVVVPSTWWENAPLVIREAFAYGRPILATDIGGMAEKVRHGIDGLLFPLNDPGALAATLVQAATEPGLWDRLRTGIRVQNEEDLVGILSLYNRYGGI